MLYIALIVTAFNGLVIGYYWGLLLLAWFRPVRPGSEDGTASHRFAIVIPAHNEELNIADTLDSCLALDYPEDRYQVFVIADNCTDRTVDLATRDRVVCLERKHDRERGKGYALSWAFERVLPQGFDILVVLDADCRIESHALRTFDRALSEGAMVLQARYAVSNPDRSIISYAAAVGNVIENDLFYAPKSELGLAVLLRGTGMVFRREVLEKCPWTASSNTEDVEYALDLIADGIPIRFLPEVSVWSDFPEGADQLRVQRQRWASGTARVGRGRGLRMILKGIVDRNMPMVDAGWTLLVLSRPLVILTVAVGCLLLAIGAVRGDGLSSAALPCAAWAEVLALGAYLFLGIVRLGLTRRRAGLLVFAPWVTIQLVWATLLGGMGLDRGVWNRTPRAGELLEGTPK